MEQIKSIVYDVIKNIQDKQAPSGDIEGLWIKSVRKKAAQHTKVRFFKKGKLHINVESPAWLYDLKLKKEDIIKKIKKLSKNKITDLRFRVGDIHGD